jgi:hypothetical protein
VRAAPLSPVVGQSDFASLGRPTTLLTRFDTHSVDTGAGDRGGAPAEVAVVAGSVVCRKDVGSVVSGSVDEGANSMEKGAISNLTSYSH